MTKAYKTPLLLIEFDQDKAFSLTGMSEVTDHLDSRSPQARLVLLLLHFPKLRYAQDLQHVKQIVANFADYA